jgi:hypothetical protein
VMSVTLGDYLRSDFFQNRTKKPHRRFASVSARTSQWQNRGGPTCLIRFRLAVGWHALFGLECAASTIPHPEPHIDVANLNLTSA